MFFDPETGIYTFREVKRDKVRYRHMPDTEFTDAIMKDASESRKEETGTNLPRRNTPTMEKAASIPYTLWLLWESMGITKDQNELRRAIERHPEFKHSKKKLI